MMASNVVVFVGYCVLLLLLVTRLCEADHTLYVGGKDGWALQPCDGLNRWAAENRFQINDTIIFRYEKGEDSVLVVHKRDYYHCNKTSPIHNMTDGNSRLKLTRSGEFYFISGQADNCDKGQKLIILVMSPKHSNPPTTLNPPPPSPSPTSSSDTPSSSLPPLAPSSPSQAPGPTSTPNKSSATAVHGSTVGTTSLWGFTLFLAPLFMMTSLV